MRLDVLSDRYAALMKRVDACEVILRLSPRKDEDDQDQARSGTANAKQVLKMCFFQMDFLLTVFLLDTCSRS